MPARGVCPEMGDGLPDQDLVEELAAPHWWVDRKGEIPIGKVDYYQMRIFQYHKGYLSSPYTATYYELAQRHPEARTGALHTYKAASVVCVV